MKRRTIGTCIAGSIVGLSGCLSTLQPDTDEDSVEDEISEEEEADSDNGGVEDSDPDSDSDSDQDHPTPVTDVSSFESYSDEQLLHNDAIGYDGSVEDLTGQSDVEIELAPGDNRVGFDPVSIQVSPGTTIRWQWSDSGPEYNLVIFEPDDSIFEIQSELTDDPDHDEELQLEMPGVYIFASQPHIGDGMVGSVIIE